MALDICNFSPLDTSTPLSNDNGFKSLDPSNCVTNTSITDTLLNCDGTNNINSINTDEIADNAVDLVGMRIFYYRQLFDLNGVHPLYGESCAGFTKPFLIKGYVNITSDDSFLAFGGIMNENDVDLQISFGEWNTKIGSDISPQYGDKFEIPDLLCNRPSGFTSATFKVTDQNDGEIFQTASRWVISGKRESSDTLHNEPSEDNNNQIMDSRFAGVVDVETGLPTEDTEVSLSETSVDDLAKINYEQDKSSVYGGYYED